MQTFSISNFCYRILFIRFCHSLDQLEAIKLPLNWAINWLLSGRQFCCDSCLVSSVFCRFVPRKMAVKSTQRNGAMALIPSSFILFITYLIFFSLKFISFFLYFLPIFLTFLTSLRDLSLNSSQIDRGNGNEMKIKILKERNNAEIEHV